MAAKEIKDKAKRRQQAEKFVLQGKITNAIAEFQKIAEESPADIPLLNTIGDLYILSGQPSQAIAYFVKVADAYIKSGFITKAIAMQKKVVGLAPQNLEAITKLADLYLKQGLSAEARGHYLSVAAALEKKGQEREAIDHYRKAIDLGPEDIETELRMARLYAKLKNPDQAKIFYSRAGTHLAEVKRTDESRQALTQALELDPACIPALKGCVRLAEATGEYGEILERLEKANQAKPDQVDLMEMMGQVCLATGRAAEAEPYFKNVVTLDENRYEHFFTLASHYYNKTELDEALRQIQVITPILLSRRETERIIKFLNEILDLSPTHVATLHQLADVYSKSNLKMESVSILSRMVDIHIGQEHYKEALHLIEQIVESDPGDSKYLQLHREIFAEAFPGEPYRPLLPESLAEEPEKTPSEVFSESVTVPHAAEMTAEVADGEAIDIEIDLSEDLKDIFAPDPPDKAPVKEIPAPEPAPAVPENSELKIPLGSLDLSVVNNHATGSEKPPTLETGIQEVEFYIRLGFLREAQKRLLEVEQDFPGHPDVMRQYETLKEEAAHAGMPLPAMPWPAESAPTPRAETPAPDIDKTQGIPENKETFDIRLDLGELDLPEAPEEPSKFLIKMLDGIRPEETDSAQSSKPKPFTKMVQEIKNLVDEDKDADFQTQFDLGVAYKEMGLHDEAIGQFQTSYRLAKDAGDQSKTARCCTLLASCFMDKGMPTATIRWAKLGLGTPGLSEDEIYALKYELASAYEKCGDTNRALECLNEIYEMNIHYRDVAQRVTQLSNSVRTK